MTAEEAYYYARQYGSCDRTRKIACQDPRWAYSYARNIDKAPREDTRDAACKYPWYAYYYAKDVDRKPHEQTKQAAYEDPKYQQEYMEFEKNWIKEQII